jgi:hypothetical protein
LADPVLQTAEDPLDTVVVRLPAACNYLWLLKIRLSASVSPPGSQILIGSPAPTTESWLPVAFSPLTFWNGCSITSI